METRKNSNLGDSRKERIFALRNVLNILFMLLAGVGVAVYITKSTQVGMVIVLVAIVIKMVECSFRLIKW